MSNLDKEIDKLLAKLGLEYHRAQPNSVKAMRAIREKRKQLLALLDKSVEETIGKTPKYKDGSYSYWIGQKNLRAEQRQTWNKIKGGDDK